MSEPIYVSGVYADFMRCANYLDADGDPIGVVSDASLLTSGTLDDARLSGNVVLLSVMQAAPTWAAIYAQTTDPGIAGQPWNNAGHFVFSTGFINGSMNFSAAQYSQYLSLVEDI